MVLDFGPKFIKKQFFCYSRRLLFPGCPELCDNEYQSNGAWYSGYLFLCGRILRRQWGYHENLQRR